MFSNTLPASVQIELGVLEDRTLQRAEGLPNVAPATRKGIILSKHVGQVHLFRQRVVIPMLTPRPTNETYHLRFTIYDLRFGKNRQGLCRPSSIVTSSIINRKRGVALIITLILLSVALFMAAGVSGHQPAVNATRSPPRPTPPRRGWPPTPRWPPPRRKSPPMLFSTTNPYNFGLLVSTNYINPSGFPDRCSQFTNVNYYYAKNGIAGTNPVAAQ